MENMTDQQLEVFMKDKFPEIFRTFATYGSYIKELKECVDGLQEGGIETMKTIFSISKVQSDFSEKTNKAFDDYGKMILELKIRIDALEDRLFRMPPNNS